MEGVPPPSMPSTSTQDQEAVLAEKVRRISIHQMILLC